MTTEHAMLNRSLRRFAAIATVVCARHHERMLHQAAVRRRPADPGLALREPAGCDLGGRAVPQRIGREFRRRTSHLRCDGVADRASPGRDRPAAEPIARGDALDGASRDRNAGPGPAARATARCRRRARRDHHRLGPLRPADARNQRCALRSLRDDAAPPRGRVQSPLAPDRPERHRVPRGIRHTPARPSIRSARCTTRPTVSSDSRFRVTPTPATTPSRPWAGNGYTQSMARFEEFACFQVLSALLDQERQRLAERSQKQTTSPTR